MSLFVPHQLHRLPKMAGKNEATSYEQVPWPYWKRVMPSLLLLILLWGTLSASLQRGLFVTTVSASGLLQSPVYNLTFQVPPTGGVNIISEIDVTQGQYVRQGQVLARLDPTLLQRIVDAAHAAVAAAQNRVNVTQARQARAIKESQALIAEAETNFHAAQVTLQATRQQAQASIAAAQATLASDQQVLAATQQQTKAQIQAGQAQLRQSIASCQPTPRSQNGSHTALTQANSVNACVYLAQTQYQQVVAEAQVAVTTAQAQVVKDQAALAQASATARLAVAIAQGQVTTTWAHILVVTYDPDLLVAAKELAEAQEDLTLALEQLQTAQLNLTTNTILIAPHDGIVTAINGTVGGPPGIHVNIAPAGVGSADTGVFIQLVDLSHVDRLLLNVSETDITKVKVGQNVQFTLKAYADRQFSGTVSAISPNGVSLDTGMAFPVIVSITSASVQGVTLFPNMTATATIGVG